MLPESTISAITNGPENVRKYADGFVSFDGPDAVNLYRLIALQSALYLEMQTGMRFSRGSLLPIANEMLGTNYTPKQKQNAYDHICSLLAIMNGEALEPED